MLNFHNGKREPLLRKAVGKAGTKSDQKALPRVREILIINCGLLRKDEEIIGDIYVRNFSY
jgi:hypothetical protein